MIKVICPYCDNSNKIEMTIDELYPKAVGKDTVYWIFDCEKCKKPFRVDFKVTYKPLQTHTYEEVKCHMCDEILYEGLDSINKIKNKILCDRCYNRYVAVQQG